MGKRIADPKKYYAMADELRSIADTSEDAQRAHGIRQIAADFDDMGRAAERAFELARAQEIWIRLEVPIAS